MKDTLSKYIYWNAGNREYYKNSGERYLEVTDPNYSFSYEKVSKAKHQFLFGDSIEDIEEQLKKIHFENLYGNGFEGNCQCPNCKRFFDLSFENYDGYLEETEIFVTCLCGKLTKFKSKFIIEVEECTTE